MPAAGAAQDGGSSCLTVGNGYAAERYRSAFKADGAACCTEVINCTLSCITVFQRQVFERKRCAAFYSEYAVFVRRRAECAFVCVKNI